MENLTKAHVSMFVPRQLFEMAPPSGESYLLELAVDTFAALEACIVLDSYPVKNLSVQNSPIGWVNFESLRQILLPIKTFQPCWTNTWERVARLGIPQAEMFIQPHLDKKDKLAEAVQLKATERGLASGLPVEVFVKLPEETQVQLIEEYKS